MCQAIADGGRRCPRHRRDSIVAMRFAASEANLPLEVVNDLFAELRREARHINMHGLEDSHEQVIAMLQEQSEANGVEQRYRDILSEHDQDAAPAPDTLYALTRIRRRAIDRSLTLRDTLGSIARTNAVSVDEVEQRFEAARAELSQGNAAVEAPEYTIESQEAAFNQDLPHDAATIVALQRTTEAYSAYGERGEPRIHQYQNPPAMDSLRVGYDPNGGRLEITPTPHASHPLNLTYRNVPEETYSAWQQDGFSLSSPVYVEHIQGNDAYRYSSPEEAELDRYQYRCSACGQFAAAAHECPHRQAIDSLLAENPERTRESLSHEEIAARVAESLPDEEEPAPTSEGQQFAVATNQTIETQTSVTPVINRETGRGARPVDPDQSVYMSAEDVAELRDRGCYRLRPYSRTELHSLLSSAAYRDSEVVVKGALTSVEELEALPNDHAVLGAVYYTYDNDPETGDHLSRRVFHIATEYNTLTHALDGDDDLYFYRHLSEGLAVNLLRRGYVTPGPRDGVTPVSELEQQRLDFGNAHGDNLHAVSPVTTWNKTYAFREGVESKIRWAGKRDFRAGINAGKVVTANIEWEEGRSRHGAQIDEFGYEIENSGFTVYGQLAMKKNDDGTYSVVSPRRELRCSCATYRRNYHCTHIDYVHNHAPKMGHQMQASAAGASQRVHGLPLTVSNHRGVTIEHDEDSESTAVSFASDPSSHYRARLPQLGETPPEAEELGMLNQQRLARLARASLYAPPASVVASAVRNADTVRVPFRLGHVQDNSLAGWNPHYYMSGDVVYGRDEDGQRTSTVENLRCSCGLFTSAEVGECPHMVLVRERQSSLLNLDERVERDEIEARAASYSAPYDGYDYHSVYRRLAQGAITEEEARNEFEEVSENIAREAAWREERYRVQQAERAERERIRRMEMAGQMMELHNEFEEQNPEYSSYRAGQKELWQSVDERYGDNTAAVKQIIEEAQTTTGDTDEYLTENVTDGVCDPNIPGSRRFGVELEFVLPSNVSRSETLAKIARELHEAGLSDSNRMGGYHSGARSGWASWNLESDATVDGELVSPLMADSPEHWAQLEKAIEILKSNGAKTSSRAGSHVHVSSGSFSGKLAKGVEVLRTVKEHEDVLFRAAADPRTSSHRGAGWCSPNVSTDYYGDVKSDEFDVLGRNAVLSTAHSNMVNMSASKGMSKKSHIEYRLWDASLDAKTIQKQVAASVAITESAERTVEDNEGESRNREAPEGAALGWASDQVGKTKAVHDKTLGNLTQFVDKVFRRKSDRDRFIRLFATKKNASAY